MGPIAGEVGYRWLSAARALPARPGSSCHWFGGRPRFVAPAQAGVQCLWSLSFAWWRLSAGGDWPGLPRRATIFLVATRKVDKETPLPQRRLAPVPSRHLSWRFGRNSPSRAQTSTRHPAGRGCAGAAEGKAATGWLRHCRRMVASIVGTWRSVTIRRPAQAGSSAFGLCRSVFGALSVGGDWSGLALAGDHLLVATRKMDKETPPCRSAPARAGAPAPPALAGRVETRPGGPRDIDAIPLPAAAAPGAAEGEGHCRFGFAIAGGMVVPQSWAWRSVTIRRSAQAGVQCIWPLPSVLGAFGWR